MVSRVVKGIGFLCFLVCAACGGGEDSGSQKSNDVGGASRSITVDGEVYYVGYGVDLVKDLSKSPYAISGTVIRDSNVTPTTVEFNYVEDAKTLTNITSQTLVFNMDGSYKKTIKGSAQCSQESVQQITFTNKSVVISARVHMEKCLFSIENEKLTEAGAAALSEGIASFVNQFGTAYVKKVKLAIDIVYLYKFDYSGKNLSDITTYKYAAEATVKSKFGKSTDYTLTKANISDISISGVTCAVSSTIPMIFPAIQDVDDWNALVADINVYSQNEDNLKYYYPTEIEYEPYSSIAEMPEEYTDIYSNAVTSCDWMTQWKTQRDIVKYVYEFTSDNDLKVKCDSTLTEIDSEISAIKNGYSEAKGPREHEAQLLLRADAVFPSDIIYSNFFEYSPISISNKTINSGISMATFIGDYAFTEMAVWDTLNKSGEIPTGYLSYKGMIGFGSYETVFQSPYNALQVNIGCKYEDYYSELTLYPFYDEQKKDTSYWEYRNFRKGTVGFCTQTVGAWRGKDDYTYVWSNVYFKLTENTYFFANQPVKASGIHKYNSSYTDFYLVYNGTSYPLLIGSPSSNMDNIVIQWDTTVSSGFINVFINGNLMIQLSIDSVLLKKEIDNYNQNFVLKSWVENGGSRSGLAHAAIEKVQIYSSIKQPEEML